MKALFVCNQNQNRSKTAELVFREKFETRSAGLFNDTPVSELDITWANIIVVMEPFQRKEIARRFPSLYLKKKIISFDIPDLYHFNQPSLVKLLRSKSHLI